MDESTKNLKVFGLTDVISRSIWGGAIMRGAGELNCEPLVVVVLLLSRCFFHSCWYTCHFVSDVSS